MNYFRGSVPTASFSSTVVTGYETQARSDCVERPICGIAGWLAKSLSDVCRTHPRCKNHTFANQLTLRCLERSYSWPHACTGTERTNADRCRRGYDDAKDDPSHLAVLIPGDFVIFMMRGVLRIYVRLLPVLLLTNRGQAAVQSTTVDGIQEARRQ